MKRTITERQLQSLGFESKKDGWENVYWHIPFSEHNFRLLDLDGILVFDETDNTIVETVDELKAIYLKETGLVLRQTPRHRAKVNKKKPPFLQEAPP